MPGKRNNMLRGFLYRCKQHNIDFCPAAGFFFLFFFLCPDFFHQLALALAVKGWPVLVYTVLHIVPGIELVVQ